MSCVEPTEAITDLLEATRAWPDVDVDQLRRRPERDQPVRWGWMMASGELTDNDQQRVSGLSRGTVSE